MKSLKHKSTLRSLTQPLAAGVRFESSSANGRIRAVVAVETCPTLSINVVPGWFFTAAVKSVVTGTMGMGALLRGTLAQGRETGEGLGR